MTAADPAVRRRGDDGSITVLCAGVIAAQMLLCAAVAAGCGALADRHHAAGAADAAAIAAAGVLAGRLPGDPCALASTVASANGADSRGCAIDGAEVVITVAVATAFGDTLVSARAGPSPRG